MNVGTVDIGEYLQLKIDGNVFYTHSPVSRESLLFCCDGLNLGCNPMSVSWPEIAEYYSSSHTSSTLTFSIETNLDENIDN
jgi:hypothetical protein